MMRSLFLILALAGRAESHGAMSFPRSRNAIDGQLPPWQGWAYPCDAKHEGDECAITFCEDGKTCQGSCPISAHNGVHNALNASNGQACYWFSNGCTIGCDRCDGSQNHVGHGLQGFLYQGMSGETLRKKNITIADPFNPPPGSMLLDPNTTATLNISSNCAHRSTNATVCSSALRTANTQAECGSADDFYYFSPWRAPGSAPVIDSCGSAGGRFSGQGTGPAGAQYENTSLAKAGDIGSKLPRMDSQATWRAGSLVEVGWTVMANHGGGYHYSLAPADAALTEATFHKTPLDFVGPSALRWDGDQTTQLEFDPAEKGWETREGTTPSGSSWRKNPIPSGLWEREGPGFEPLCAESEECIRGYSTGKGGKPGVCRCSGYSNGGPLLPSVEIVDRVRIPADLAPGRYVLQWRWDCEESDQVWASCSNVAVTE